MWLLFSQLSALAETAVTLLAKKSMATYDSTVVTWFWVTSSVIVLFPIIVLTGIPTISQAFYPIIILRVILDTFALLLYTKALHLDDISLVTPLLNFSAVFSLLFSFFINQEVPSALGLIGVVAIVVGAYFLHFNKNESPLKPLTTILTKKASLFMILSTMLYGVIFSISKGGIQSSNLFFYTFAAAFGLSLTIFPIALFANKKDLFKILKPKNAVKLFPLGLIDVFKILFLMQTINTSYVAFADASNNTSILYNIAASKYFLHEKVKKRVLPVIVMFSGLVLIVFFG